MEGVLGSQPLGRICYGRSVGKSAFRQVLIWRSRRDVTETVLGRQCLWKVCRDSGSRPLGRICYGRIEKGC